MIKALEGGRGVAALIVALYHLKIGTQDWSVLRNGYLFVDLFFVLSGFVICAAYAGRMNTADDLRGFVVRRIGRLLPLQLFATLFFIAIQNGLVLAKRIAASSGHAGALNSPDSLQWIIPDPVQLLAVATFTHGMGLFDDLILNTPSWSISTEFFTYLLFAAVCLLLRAKLRLLVFATLVLIGFGISVWASVQIHDCLIQGGCLSLTYDFGFPRSVFSFFLGALCWHLTRAAGANTKTQALQLPAVIVLGMLLMLVDAHVWLAFAFPFAFALLIISVSSDRGALAWLLQTRALQVLGERSYSVYLLHMPLVMVFQNLAQRAEASTSKFAIVLAFVATLLWLSGLTYRFIEQPCRSWFNRRAASHAAATAPTSSKPVPAPLVRGESKHNG